MHDHLLNPAVAASDRDYEESALAVFDVVRAMHGLGCSWAGQAENTTGVLKR